MILLAALALAAGPTALPNCVGQPQVKPAQVIFACADANFGIRKLQWIGWGDTRAAATGTVYANDCTPTCVAGHFHNYPAVIVVDGRQQCGSVTAYKRVTIAFIGPSPYPKSKPADLVYTYRCH